MKRMKSSAAVKSPPWLELPREITSLILQKLGAIELLTAAQSVCKAWLSVCQDPSTWRIVNLRSPVYLNLKKFHLEKMCRYAVDRSQGQLIDISVEYVCENELLFYISQRCRKLRHLRIAFCDNISSEAMIEAVKHFPLLEELRLYYVYTDAKAIEAIGRSCPLLKSFTLNNLMDKNGVRNSEALAVAGNMPGLRQLQLVGNRLSNVGLRAILDGCPHLESLDLRQCSNVNLDRKIGRECLERIRDVKPPREESDSDSDYDDGYDYD